MFRGWTTEEDKKKKILQLPEVRAAVARMLGSNDSRPKTTNARRRMGSLGIGSDEELLDSEHTMEEASEGSADSSSETVTGNQIDIDTFCDNGICSLGGSKCR